MANSAHYNQHYADLDLIAGDNPRKGEYMSKPTPTTSPEPDAVREALAVECSDCVIPRPEQMNIYRAHDLLKRAAIALSRPAHGGKSLSDYTMGELQSEVHRRAQQVLGDPRVGVAVKDGGAAS